MASITSPGIGSGLDINSIVSQLLTIEAQAPSLRLDRREADLQVRLSSYGSVKSGLSSLQSSLAALNDIATYKKTSVSSTDKTIVEVSATGQAAASKYDITVSTLADSHKLSTDPSLTAAKFTAVTDVIGTGTITFKFGTTDYTLGTDTYTSFTQNATTASATVTITDGSLQGVRDAINQANVGATASIVYDGTNYRLSITSNKSGADNSIEVTVADDDADNTNASGLSLLAFNSVTNHAVQTGAGVDAAFTVNGIGITSASNVVTNAIENVSLTLKLAGTTTVNVSKNNDAISAAVLSFVDAYNNYTDTINNLTAYDPDTRQAGALNGDGVLRNIVAGVKKQISNPVGDTSQVLRILADIGITTDPKTGRLNADTTKLNKQLTDNADKFVELFAAYGATTNSFVNFSGSSASTKAGNYEVNITQLATLGKLVGSAAANTTIVAGVNDTLDLTIDGIIATVTLTAGTYSASTLISEVQSKINTASAFTASSVSVAVTESAGVLTITSQRYGSASKVTVTGGNGKTDLVGGSATATDGLDVTGTIGGTFATGSGQKLTGSAGNSSGLAVLITGTTTGVLDNVDFKRGYADILGTYIGSLLDTNGIFSSTSTSIQSQIEDITDDRASLQRRISTIEARLRSQFSALDVLVSQLQSTSSYLSQQLATLPTVGASRK